MNNTNNDSKRETSIKCVVVFIVVAIIVPFAISAAFKIHPHRHIFSAEWTADGYLGYIGALIGAAATIYAVRVTIINERKRQEEERIISAKPWLVSETLLLCSNEEIQEEENGSTTFVSLNGDFWGSGKGTPSKIKSGSHEINKTDCVIKYEIMNVGGNSATRLKLTLDDYPLFPDFALAKDQVKKIIFVLPLREGEKQSQYVLKFAYGDVVSTTTYSQIEVLNIMQDEYGVTFSQSMADLLTAPKKENENEPHEI